MPLRDVTPLKAAYRRAGVWQDEPLFSIVDRHAEVHPDKIALIDQQRSFTYSEAVQASRRLARWLVSLDLDDGAVVACQTPSTVLLAIVHLACNRANLICLPLSDGFRRRELHHLLQSSRAAVAFVPASDDDRDRYTLVDELGSELPDLRVLGAFSGSADISLPELIARGPAKDIRRTTDPDLPRHAMITSGTTALSRISLWSDNNLWALLSTFRDYVHLGPGDTALGLAPANGGSTGYVFPVLAPLLFGASSVLLQRWDTDAAISLFGKVRPTVATAIPTQIVQLLTQPDVFAEAARGLRAFNNAGAPLPPEAAQRTEELLGCRIQTSYGASDGGVPTMTTIDDPPDKRARTVGRPLAETEVRLVDGNLQQIPKGEAGEVLWRTPTKSFGYLNNPEHDARSFWEDGWYRSGDLGSFDDDGYLQIVGRSKDMILRGGRNISPVEIEDLLIRSPLVDDVAIVGVADEMYGERVCACIVSAAGAQPTLDDLVEFLRDQGAESFKLPERVERFDALPRNVGEKVDKKALLAQIENRSVTKGAP